MTGFKSYTLGTQQVTDVGRLKAAFSSPLAW